MQRSLDSTRYYSRAATFQGLNFGKQIRPNGLAERAGFEPAGAFQRRALSKRVP
jgi:hypothetical protein